MKLVIAIVFCVVAFIDPITIVKINSAKADAKKSFNDGDYKSAIAKYRYLTDSLRVTEDEVMLNLANAYFLTNDTTNASSTYQGLAGSPKPVIRSKAQHQLGILNHKSGKMEEALNNFKQAIKADANNKDARYNYEILKKKLDEKKKKDEEQNKNKNKEPSEFAKKLKAQADALAAQYKFKAAQDLLEDGLQKDPTVAHYNDYIERLKSVVTINKK